MLTGFYIPLDQIEKQVYYQVYQIKQTNETTQKIEEQNNTINLGLKSKYEIYLEKVNERRQKEILKYKQKVLKYLDKVKLPPNIQEDIKKMVEIENQFKMADGILIFKISNDGKFLFKVFKFNGKHFLLIINPIIVFDNLKEKKISEKYKKELKEILLKIATAQYQQQGDQLEDTYIYKQLQILQKQFNLTSFYELIPFSSLKLQIIAGDNGKTPIYKFKDLNLEYYNNLYYIPEKLKYVVDNKHLYFYIPITRKLFQEENLLLNKNLNKLCYYINFNNYNINKAIFNQIAFCGIGRYFTIGDKNFFIKANSFYDYNEIDLNKAFIPRIYEAVQIYKRPRWTIFFDLGIAMLGIVFAWLVFKAVNKQEKIENIYEKEML